MFRNQIIIHIFNIYSEIQNTEEVMGCGLKEYTRDR